MFDGSINSSILKTYFFNNYLSLEGLKTIHTAYTTHVEYFLIIDSELF